MKPRAFASAIVIGLSSVAVAGVNAAAPGQQRQRQMRFQAMDANGDGRISRAEWRGNDQSFSQHDWNGDGILSGDEVRVGASRQWADEDEFDQTRRPEFRNWTARGFTNLDQNRDGEIERSEWFYDREGFLRADRNGDGLLTRAEFLSVDVDADRDGQFARTDLFESLDTNNDSVITPNEWQWSRRSFAQQDQNGDGQLTRRELTNTELEAMRGGAVGGGAVGTSGRIVTIQAARGWVDTGIDVRRGDRISIDASGTVTLSNNSGDVAEPAGSRSGRRADSAPLRDDPAGALIARVSDGAPVMVGDQRTFTASDTGRLYLSVNDDFLADNVGEYRATVSVNR
jgi:Ca2+-binding EF-hand superfamily protein